MVALVQHRWTCSALAPPSPSPDPASARRPARRAALVYTSGPATGAPPSPPVRRLLLVPLHVRVPFRRARSESLSQASNDSARPTVARARRRTCPSCIAQVVRGAAGAEDDDALPPPAAAAPAPCRGSSGTYVPSRPVCTDSWNTGMSASGYMSISSGTQAPWSSPRRRSSATGPEPGLLQELAPWSAGAGLCPGRPARGTWSADRNRGLVLKKKG